jgi:hypothetical protein
MYELQWKTSSATTWSSFNNLTVNSSLLYALSPSTTYQWRVRPICANGVICWSNGSNFTTPAACVDSYENPSNNTNSGARTMVLGTIYKGTIPNGDVDWFKFTIPLANSTFTVSLNNLANNFKLNLYNSNGTSLLATSDNVGLSNERITRTTTTANTTYSVQVLQSSTNFDAATCYQLSAALGSAFESGIATQAIDNQGDLKIDLFPNPTNGLVQLQISAANPNGVPVVEITDLLGRKWQQKVLSEPVAKDEPYLLDLNGYQEGIYLVRVQLGNQVSTHKVRVQR